LTTRKTLIKAVSDLCAELKGRIELASAVLEAGSPLAVMERGFSVVTDSSGNVICNSADVKKGEKLRIKPLKGTIHAVAENVEA